MSTTVTLADRTVIEDISTQLDTASTITDAISALVPIVAKADEIRRVAYYSALRAELRQRGVCGAAEFVRALQRAVARHTGDGGAGEPVEYRDPEPWDHPVNGERLLNTIRDTVRRFMVLPDGGAEAIALWIVHTYALDAAETTPILAVLSPVHRCGKTRTLDVLDALVRRPQNTLDMTPPAIFRAAHQHEPTFLIDEADTIFSGGKNERAEELRAILNSSTTRNNARVIRCVGDDHELRAFRTWCAKAIGMIGRLPETLSDRSIIVRLRRRAPAEVIERLRRAKIHGELEPIRRCAMRWVQDHRQELEAQRDGDPPLPEALNDRAQDNWRPLIAIADVAGGHWPETARRVAVQLSGGEADEEVLPIELLRDLREIFAGQADPALPTATLVQRLVELEDRPWATLHRGRPMTARDLARLLATFEVRPRTLRFGGRLAKGYSADDLQDAWGRYLQCQTGTAGGGEAYVTDPPGEGSVTPLQVNKINEMCPSSSEVTLSVVTGAGWAENVNEIANVTDVTDQMAERSVTASPRATSDLQEEAGAPEWHHGSGTTRCQTCGIETHGTDWCETCLEGDQG
jgi:putative DNA primase/helicase